jgi:hypothetical protein
VICIRPICVLVVLILSISTVLGDVRISHSYSTEGGEVNEDVQLHNVDYANSVSILQDSLFAAADSVIGDGDEIALFGNQILTRGEGGLFGVNLKAGAEEKFNHHMSLATGRHATDKTGISYNLESGVTEAEYFTGGGSVHEGIIVDNVNYNNKASIYPQYLYCSADADLVDGIGTLMDNIRVDSGDGVFGTLLMAKANEQLSLDKGFKAGYLADAKADITYTLESGVSDAKYFNPLVKVDEAVLTDSCMYRGSIKNSVDELHSSGQGKVTEDDFGRFNHNISMTYDELPCDISASLTTGDEVYGSRTDVPALYGWETHVDIDDGHAMSMVGAKGYNGNRDMDFAIEGESIGLADKIAGPTHISPLGFIGISKELYMSYEITR